LDRLLLVVANDPWQKSPSRAITPAEDRFAMTRALAAEIPGAEASRLEIDRGGPSYSVETAEALLAGAAREGRPAPVLYLVVGADLLGGMDSWERADELKQLVRLVAVSRPGAAEAAGGAEGAGAGHRAPPAPPGWRVEWVDGPQVDVSSSAVRDRLHQGAGIEDFVPPEVVRCIRRRNLYAVGR
jgi:nicotinate-nucleotide adenylyltransferase